MVRQGKIIEYKDRYRLPSVPELKRELEDHDLKIAFDDVMPGQKYLDIINEELPDYFAFVIEWQKYLYIIRSLDTNQIINNSGKILDCAREFGKTANNLMERLADKFQVDLNNITNIKHRNNNKQSGVLDNEWEFHFYGGECRFTNLRTGQRLYVVLALRPEFGVIGAYFFKEFINSTPKFHELRDLFQNADNRVAKALYILEKNGYLSRMSDGISSWLVVR